MTVTQVNPEFSQVGQAQANQSTPHATSAPKQPADADDSGTRFRDQQAGTDATRFDLGGLDRSPRDRPSLRQEFGSSPTGVRCVGESTQPPALVDRASEAA